MRNIFFVFLLVVFGLYGSAVVVNAEEKNSFVEALKLMTKICEEDDYDFCEISEEPEHDGVDSNGGYIGAPVVVPSDANAMAVKKFISGVSSKLRAINVVWSGDDEVGELPKSDAFKAIVKIKTYVYNEMNDLTLLGTGSGIVIDSSGIVLTNHHVVTSTDSFDGSDRDASFQVCLTESIEKEPNCTYIGKLIASDREMDMALLQIVSVPGLSDDIEFDYLKLNDSDETDVNDQVTAIGYPALGGETVTITQGIVSGKLEKYGQNWIKTDAIISFGSSGGAALDVAGNVIGINTRAHSDLLGNLGYIVNINSVNDWILFNRDRSPQESGLFEELKLFTKKQIGLKMGNAFLNDYPKFSIVKPGDWGFIYEDNNNFSVDNEGDENGGLVIVNMVKFPYLIDTGNVIPYINKSFAESGLISMVDVTKEEDVVVGGLDAKKVTLTIAGEFIDGYYVPYNEYLISVAYLYGKGDKDKVVVDGIINSIAMELVASDFKELKQYVNDRPRFSVESEGDWVMMAKNQKESPLWVVNKKIKDVDFTVSVVKLNEGTRGFGNEELVNYFEDQTKSAGRMMQMMGLKFEISNKESHYKLNDELNDVGKYDLVLLADESGEELVYATLYIVRGKNELVLIEVNGYGVSRVKYEEALNILGSEVLSSFSLVDYEVVGADKVISGGGISRLVIGNRKMHDRLKGRILLKVEDRGKAYYVNPKSEEMYYLGRAEDAFEVMRGQGVGITNANLDKIEIGIMDSVGSDSDGDGLSDMFEDAIGTDKNDVDSDGDGFRDKVELVSSFNPRGSGKLMFNQSFSDDQRGKIFLQVESAGEAWYVNPADGKRYFLGRPADAYNAMRNLGLGISNSDFLLME